jgi:hypothetical protein
MSNDRYSDDHIISIKKGAGTLSIEGNVSITGDLDLSGSIISGGISGDLSFTGNISLPSTTTIETDSGTIDFSTSNTVQFQVPMFYLKQLIEEGYSTAGSGTIEFVPFLGVPDTTSSTASPSPPYMDRAVPSIRLYPGGSFTVPLHEFIRSGRFNSIKMICESTAATSIQDPFSFDLEICTKIGTGVFTTSSSQNSISVTPFVNNTRRAVTVYNSFINPIDINPNDQFAFCTITLNPLFAHEMAVYSVNIAVNCDPLQALGYPEP